MTVAFSEALPLGEESASFLNPSIFFFVLREYII